MEDLTRPEMRARVGSFQQSLAMALQLQGCLRKRLQNSLQVSESNICTAEPKKWTLFTSRCRIRYWISLGFFYPSFSS